MAPRLVSALALASAFVATGCASARMSDTEADRLFRARQYDRAAEHLKKGLADQGDNGRDILLYLMDIGLSLHSAGQYDESTRYFLKADKMAEIKDYTSLSKETATLLTSDNIKDYRGEDFENVLINTYLAMNYALQGNSEDAEVEARRVNQKLYRMVSEGGRKYKQNAFARYLSACLYEADGNVNDAYVDYKEAYRLVPEFPGLGRDLWRMARLGGENDDMAEWDQKFGLTDEDHRQAMWVAPQSNKGEIIVLYENGISPIKRPNPSFREIPKFFARSNPTSHAVVKVSGPTNATVTTAMLENIEATAMQNLEEKYAGLVAKKLAGIVAKEVVSDQIGKRTSPILGLAAKLAFYASDQADCRSWNLLPHDLQIARIAVDPGQYAVHVEPVGAGAVLADQSVAVKAGKKVFLDFRFMP